MLRSRFLEREWAPSAGRHRLLYSRNPLFSDSANSKNNSQFNWLSSKQRIMLVEIILALSIVVGALARDHWLRASPTHSRSGFICRPRLCISPTCVPKSRVALASGLASPTSYSRAHRGPRISSATVRLALAQSSVSRRADHIALPARRCRYNTYGL